MLFSAFIIHQGNPDCDACLKDAGSGCPARLGTRRQASILVLIEFRHAGRLFNRPRQKKRNK